MFRFATAAATLISAAFVTLPTSASATAVVAPSIYENRPARASNRFPFFDGGHRYQQVFDATEFGSFTGPTDILSIAFRCETSSCRAFSESITATIQLSTTTASVDGLSTRFSDNIGGDVTTVKDGTFDIASAGRMRDFTTFDVMISFDNPFVYDPTQGNLLVDFLVTNSPGDIGIFLDATNSTADSVSRVWSNTSGNTLGNADSRALIAKFNSEDVAPVPVPPAALLAFGGFAVLRSAQRLSKKN